jgi:hypothetical protein
MAAYSQDMILISVNPMSSIMTPCSNWGVYLCMIELFSPAHVSNPCVAGRRWYHTARVIMAEDALRRQNAYRFGCRGPLTTDIEADESCFFSWNDFDPTTKERVYYWFVWLSELDSDTDPASPGLPHEHIG